MNAPPRNWNRWGPGDQRGTLNYVTPEKIKRSIQLVRRGSVYSLAIPLQAEAPIWPTRHKNWHMTTHVNCAGPGLGGAEDMLVMHTHGTTHIDALCHVFRDGLMYNGFPADKMISSEGALRNSISNVEGIITRGVLIDVASYNGVESLDADHAITPEEIEAIAEHQHVSVETGDALLFRTGFMKVWRRSAAEFNRAQPGITLATAEWAGTNEIVLLGADNSAVEKFGANDSLLVHGEFICSQGGYLVELLNLEELAKDKIYEFLLVIAPLRITNGLGSPLNPIALA